MSVTAVYFNFRAKCYSSGFAILTVISSKDLSQIPDTKAYHEHRKPPESCTMGGIYNQPQLMFFHSYLITLMWLLPCSVSWNFDYHGSLQMESWKKRDTTVLCVLPDRVWTSKKTQHSWKPPPYPPYFPKHGLPKPLSSLSSCSDWVTNQCVKTLCQSLCFITDSKEDRRENDSWSELLEKY